MSSNTYTNCVVNGCDKFTPSACINYTGPAFNCNNEAICHKTLDELFTYIQPRFCKLISDTDVSTLNRLCYTTDSNTNITVVSVLQDLIELHCDVAGKITDIYTYVDNYFPNYTLETLQFKCIGVDPCLEGQSLSIKTTFQRLIDKICEINGSVITLQGLLDTSPINYPINRTLYTNIGNELGTSDLENLYIKSDLVFGNIGTSSQVATALAYDCYGSSSTIAESIQHLWQKVCGMSSGGSGTGSYSFDSYFAISGNNVSLNCATLKTCIDSTYIRNQFSAGDFIDISPSGVISYNPGLSGLNQPIRQIVYDSTLTILTSTDLNVSYIGTTDLNSAGAIIVNFSAQPGTYSAITVEFIDYHIGTSTKSRMLIPGLDYTINTGRTGITIGAGVLPAVAFNILNITYTT